jgi:hypothetical protein
MTENPAEVAALLMRLSVQANLAAERIERMPTAVRRLAPIASDPEVEIRRITGILQAVRAR